MSSSTASVTRLIVSALADAVELAQVRGDVARAHPARVEVQHARVQAGQARLALFDQLRRKGAVTVAWGADPDRPEIGRKRLRGRPVTHVGAGWHAARRVSQVLAHSKSRSLRRSPAMTS